MYLVTSYNVACQSDKRHIDFSIALPLSENFYTLYYRGKSQNYYRNFVSAYTKLVAIIRIYNVF